jgi:hypothetical protein
VSIDRERDMPVLRDWLRAEVIIELPDGQVVAVDTPMSMAEVAPPWRVALPVAGPVWLTRADLRVLGAAMVNPVRAERGRGPGANTALSGPNLAEVWAD